MLQVCFLRTYSPWCMVYGSILKLCRITAAVTLRLRTSTQNERKLRTLHVTDSLGRKLSTAFYVEMLRWTVKAWKKHNILHLMILLLLRIPLLLCFLLYSFFIIYILIFYILCFLFKVLPLFSKSCAFSFFLYLLTFSLFLFFLHFFYIFTSSWTSRSGCERCRKYNKNQSAHQIFTTFPLQHRLRFTLQVHVHVCMYLCSQYACTSLTVEIMFTNRSHSFSYCHVLQVGVMKLSIARILRSVVQTRPLSVISVQKPPLSLSSCLSCHDTNIQWLVILIVFQRMQYRWLDQCQSYL